MAYAVDALNVIPYGPTEFRGVHIAVATHGEVRQIVGGTKFLIQQSTYITVQTIEKNKILIFCLGRV